MMAWRARCGKDKCTYRTKFDDVLSGREWSRGGKSARDCLVFTVDDSIYADDTALRCISAAVWKWDLDTDGRAVPEAAWLGLVYML